MDVQKILKTAISYHNSNRTDKAEVLYRDILRSSLGHPVASVLLSKILLRDGRFSETGELLSRVLSAHPYYMQAYNVAGDYFGQIGNEEKAIRSYKRALLMEPTQSGPSVSLANIMQAKGDLGRPNNNIILNNYKKAVICQPKFIPAINNLAGMQLKMHKPKDALATLTSAADLNATNVRSIAYKTIALLGAGQVSEAYELIGFKTLVRSKTINLNDTGYDLDSFNKKLRQALLEHPNLTSDWDPKKRAIRGGAIAPRLFEYATPILDILKKVLTKSINKYISCLPNNLEHPYLGNKPRQYAIDIWGNILRSSDHQSGHIHNQGWMSGVYYVSMPPNTKKDEKYAGWIEFNRPGYGLPLLGGEKHIRKIEPRPGMLIMFPSYVWHGTIPFFSQGDRISIAFDLHSEDSQSARNN